MQFVLKSLRPGLMGACLLGFAVLLSGSAIAPSEVVAQTEAVPQPEDRVVEALGKIIPQLEAQIREGMDAGNIPSVTIALTDRMGEIWAEGYGESNLWAGTPASAETVYLIGSTFKAQSTIALLQQMESGLFRLDDPVAPYLTEFTIRNEEPGRPVTFRNLLTHTSGLPTAYGGHNVWGETVPASLEEYLSGALRVEGPPMARTTYSNLRSPWWGIWFSSSAGFPTRNTFRSGSGLQ